MHHLKKLFLISTIIPSILYSFTAIGSEAQSAEVQAMNDMTIQVAVAKGSKAWKDAFNAGDAAAATALYEDNAVMIVKPFGTFKGKEAILSFWTDIINKGFDDVIYSQTKTTILNGESASVSSDWSMNNAKGIITNEFWVMQADGSALMREDHFEITP